MTAQEITLNIAINLGRIARWALEKKEKRVKQFLTETDGFLQQLNEVPKSERFLPTFKQFKKRFLFLKDAQHNEDWAEEFYTWANILSHRAKLA